MTEEKRVCVLFATDASPGAFDAERLITKAFRTEAIAITVLHVMKSVSMRQPRELVSEHRKEAEHVVRRLAGRLEKHGFKTDTHVEEGGDPAFVIGRAAATYEVTILAPAKSTWLDKILGSVSRSVYWSSQSSLLLVHYALNGHSPANVLVGYDGSAGSKRAIDLAARLLDPVKTRVTVLCVGELPIRVPSPPIAEKDALLTELEAEEGARVLEIAQSTAAEGAQLLKNAGFEVSSRAVRGSARSSMLEELYREEYDLAVVGARKAGRVTSALLGSISEPIARRAAAALVVR